MDTSVTARSRDERAAIDKAVSLLAVFGAEASTGVGVSELARRAQLSKSTAYRLLGMLERNGVVERVGSDYRLGRRLGELGPPAPTAGADLLRDALTPYLADLYELTHETVHLAVLDGADVVYVAKLHGHRPVPSPSRVGGRAPAYCTAVGKALLAYDADRSEQVLSRPLDQLTPWTLSDPESLRSELASVLREGVAFDRQEVRPGLTCVAVPVLGPDGRPLAALSVAGPSGRFDPQDHAAALRKVSHAAAQTLRRSVTAPPR